MFTGSLGVGGHQDLSLKSFFNFLSRAEEKGGEEDQHEEVTGQGWRLLYKLQAIGGLRPPSGKRVTLPSKSKDTQEANLRAKTADNQ